MNKFSDKLGFENGNFEIKQLINKGSQKGEGIPVGQGEIDKYGQDKFEYGPEERAAMEKVFASLPNKTEG